MKFEDCLCFKLGKAARAMTRTYRSRLASHGLTHIQFFLLIALYEKEGMSVSELAAKVALDKSTMTGLIDRMEREGFVERHQNPNDRRAYCIYLTEKARDMRKDLISIYREVNSMYLHTLSEEEKRILEEIVAKIESIPEVM